MSRRRISRSPTNCATCSPARRCALSTARASAPRSRNSTRRANMRRSGPQAGKLTASAKGVIARLKDAAADGLNPADYPVPDFAAATSPDQLADAELKLTASMLDYARQAQSGRMHWSQVAADILYPEHPTDPAEVLANITTAKDASAALDGYNPPHQALQGVEGQARRTARPGRRPGGADRGRRCARIQGRPPRSSRRWRRKIRACRNCAPSSASPKTPTTPIRRQGRRRRAQIPGKRRPQADRRARRPDRQGDQQPEARPPDRHRDRQHGALALAAAPARRAVARQRLCHPQHPRLHAQGDAERRARSGPPAS